MIIWKKTNQTENNSVVVTELGGRWGKGLGMMAAPGRGDYPVF